METKSLSCPLSDEEFKLRATKLSQLIAERDRIESEKKMANDGFNSRLKAVDEEVSHLAEIVRDKAEFRAVPVDWVKDLKRGIVELVRLDTETVIDSRAMTPAEKQASLNFGSSKKKADAAAKDDGSPIDKKSKRSKKGEPAPAPTVS